MPAFRELAVRLENVTKHSKREAASSQCHCLTKAKRNADVLDGLVEQALIGEARGGEYFEQLEV